MGFQEFNGSEKGDVPRLILPRHPELVSGSIFAKGGAVSGREVETSSG
jgi:hypothetical protein